MATHDISQLQYADPLVQSPSATNQWMTCQTLWRFTKQYGLHGQAVQEGRELAGLIHRLRQGKALKPTANTQLTQLAYTAISSTSKLFGAPLYTELTLGKARIDEVFAINTGGVFNVPLIIDYKYFPVIDGVKQASFIAERFKYDHQLMHYAWAYSQYVYRWQSSILSDDTMKIGVCLLTNAPDMLVYVASWVVNKQMLLRWLQYTIEVWRDMLITDSILATRNLKSCHGTVYGQCNMYDRCWVPSA